MTTHNYKDIDLIELEKIAHNISSNLTIGDVICLTGDLGAGKTTLAKLIIQNLLQAKEEVTSPTFNLVHTYDTAKGRVWHFDLYRLEKSNDIIELGIDDALEYGISIIEWPQIIHDILPNHAVNIELSFSDQDHLRNLSIKKQ